MHACPEGRSWCEVPEARGDKAVGKRQGDRVRGALVFGGVWHQRRRVSVIRNKSIRCLTSGFVERERSDYKL